jgi:acetyltransferase
MSFEPFAENLITQLRAEVPVPEWIPVENPLDTTFKDERSGIDYAEGIYAAMVRSFHAIARSARYDALLAIVDFSQFRGAYETDLTTGAIAGLGAAAAEADVFGAIVSFHAADPPAQAAALAREHGVPLLRGGRHSMRAIQAVATWQPRRRPPSAAGERQPLEVNLREGALNELESTAVLERYGAVFAPRCHARSAAEAADAAEALGLPVVVKVHGPAHKALAGGVVVGVDSRAAARAAAEQLGGEVIIARQVPAGPEILCGMTRDSDYGPLIAVGIGGRVVEALGLAAVGLSTLDIGEALGLVEQAPGVPELTTRAAREAIARIVVAMSRLAEDHPAIAECEINPLIVHEHGATGVDALIVVGPE